MFELHAIAVDSRLLRGNAAGDPHERRLLVLAPSGHDPARPLPAIWMIPGLGNSQGSFLADDPWKESLARRAGRLLRDGALAPVLLVLPDLWTRFGGSQVLDSSATGPYESHLWRELKPALESRFAVRAHGIAGHSSGGYAALVQAMRHPEIVRAAACHAGDMLFEYAYLPDFPKAADALRREGGVERLLGEFDVALKKFDSRFMAAMNIVAMAACYSPDSNAPAGLALPFSLETGEIEPRTWRRWLALDPVRLAELPDHQDALRSLKALYVDVGTRDEFNLHWGARALRQRLVEANVAHVYEEFADSHTGTAYRFDRSLPLLAAALSS